jgi:hypothetical protein
MKKLFPLFSLLALTLSGYSQKQQYQVVLTGFYNLENMYDTINDPNKDDEEFLPGSEYHYNSAVYFDKIGRLASVISQMGLDFNPDGLAILGVAEIENDTVLNDLLKTDALRERKLKYVHYNSPDVRGVDVGLIYNPKYFKVLYSKALFVQLPGGSKDSWFTRDVLYVKGILAGDTINVFVNHWPSRRGGEERSAPARAAAAGVVKKVIDSLNNISKNTKCIIMGDLNDDPISPSITKVLGAKLKAEEVQPGGIFNPFGEFYKKGIGTSPYQDAWGLFDQQMISYGWLNKEQPGFHYYKAMIFNKEWMVQKTGKYKGYTKRTWDGTTYNYGYSDHFPVFLVMLKKAN